MAALVISCHSTGRNEQLILVPTPLGGTATSHSKIGEFNNCEKVRENWSSSYKQTGGGEGTPVREEPTYCGLHRLVCSVENVLVYSVPCGREMARVSQVE